MKKRKNDKPQKVRREDPFDKRMTALISAFDLEQLFPEMECFLNKNGKLSLNDESVQNVLKGINSAEIVAGIRIAIEEFEDWSASELRREAGDEEWLTTAMQPQLAAMQTAIEELKEALEKAIDYVQEHDSLAGIIAQVYRNITDPREGVRYVLGCSETNKKWKHLERGYLQKGCKVEDASRTAVAVLLDTIRKQVRRVSGSLRNNKKVRPVRE